MEENKNMGLYDVQVEQESKSSFNVKAMLTTFLLNWKWFAFSIILFVGLAVLYLRYTTPIYQASAKLLIKDNGSNNQSRRNSIMSTANLGTVSNTMSIDNELELLKTKSIAQQAVRDLKLYVSYEQKGRMRNVPIYKTQSVSVDIDPGHLENLNSPISLEITREGNGYHVLGTYNYVSAADPSKSKLYGIDKKISQLPTTINTKVGTLSFSPNGMTPMMDGTTLLVKVSSPKMAAGRFAGSLFATQKSETTTIVNLLLSDAVPGRAIDYLRQLVVCYNRQANDDKNEIAIRTEEFINGRIEKISAELGETEGALETYKKRNNMVELSSSAGQALAHQDSYNQKIVEADMQMDLLNSINNYIDRPENKYQTLPSNVGLTDGTANSLISKYNEVVLERNRMLQSASENSPVVVPLTAQLDDLTASIKSAMNQAKRDMNIQRNNMVRQYNIYSGQVSSTPEQERVLSQIGRQQDVKSSLFVMLLQKREENSISLAATADKGMLLDDPSFAGQIFPKRDTVLLVAFSIGLFLPAIFIFLVRFFRYKIEGHDDVAALTDLPIVADVAVASETGKTKGEIVVHENRNNQMEEIFRSMRTNLQFMLNGDQKVIMFTSSTSGEGKTFNAANLAVSFALLDKKVILVGLDIRKPRLADLFEIDDHHHGITSLLTKASPTEEDIRAQLIPSGVNNNLDILAGGVTPPNPSELLTRSSLDKVFEILKKKYDYIIVDTAPVGLVTDTLHIGRISDVTVFVCRADYTPKSAFDYINKLSEEKKLPNVCVVINGIDMSKKKYGYYYGYKSYGYGAAHRTYTSYGTYSNSRYGDKNDTSVKL